MIERKWYYLASLDENRGNSDEGKFAEGRIEAPTEIEANLVSSETNVRDVHLPVIDVDVPARLVPSSTEGHSHLYIDVPMTWARFENLLGTLVDCGIVQEGYLNACRSRKAAFVRKPGCYKPAPIEAPV